MNRFSKTITLVLAAAMVFSGSSLFAGADPVERTFQYSGSTITASAYDGYALIGYPGSVTEVDVEAFLAYETAQYPADAAAVSYSFPEEGVLRLDYPEGLSDSERAAFLDIFLSDINKFAPAPAPSVYAFDFNGRDIVITVTDGLAAISYPEYITEAEVEGFFAYEVATRGAELDGIVYSFPASGTVELAYPETVSRETAEAYAPVLLSARLLT